MTQLLIRFSLLYTALMLFATKLVAQTTSASLVLPTGELVEQLVAGSDTTQRYALYLPADYRAGSSHPVLFLMDPRGRALVPLELFREAAERYGYVIMSSYNTLSDADSAFVVNDRALTAMILDAQVRFTVDVNRFYLVGFSGTAHYSWIRASQLDGHLAGIIGVGGGLPAHSLAVQSAIKMKRPFAFFGIAGTADFNYDHVRLLDQALDSTRIPHRFVSFGGPHSWPPKPIADAGVDWIQLQAMRNGLAPRDESRIDSMCTVYLSDAQQLERTGFLFDAMRRYREVSADCEGLDQAVDAKQRMEELAENSTVRRDIKSRDKLVQQIMKYKRTVSNFLKEYRHANKPPLHNYALRRLKIESLKRNAADSADPEQSNAARRMLAYTGASTGFYEPRDYLQQKDYRKAAGMLRLAREIRPDSPYTCYWLAQAEAQLNNTNEALDELACTVDRQFAYRSTLEQDPLLTPLHNEPRFWEILDRAPEISAEP